MLSFSPSILQQWLSLSQSDGLKKLAMETKRKSESHGLAQEKAVLSKILGPIFTT